VVATLNGEPQQKHADPGPSEFNQEARVATCVSSGVFVVCLTKTSLESVLTCVTLLLWSDRRTKAGVKFPQTVEEALPGSFGATPA
jgi:hypothetical protein